MSWVLDKIMEWLLEAVLGIFNAIIGMIEHGLLISPDVTGLPQVQALTGKSTWIVDTCFVLVFVAAGALIMVTGGDERSRYTLKDLAPRMVVGFISAHFSTLLVSQAIGLANGLTAGLTADRVDHNGAMASIRSQVVAAAGNPAHAMLVVILIGIIAVLLAMTTFGLVVRFGVLLILAAIAPVALACHALPQTDPVARLWWRSLWGCLLTPVLQAFTLQAGATMLLDPNSTLPTLGLPADPLAMANLFIVLVLLWITVKIPGLVRQYVTRSQGSRLASQIVRVVIIQQGMRALGLRGGGGGRTVARAAR